MNNILKKIYYNSRHPAGFKTANALWKAANGKISKANVKKWLENQDIYTLNRLLRKRFPRNRYIVNLLDHLWQADLNDMRSLKKHNDGYNYVLTVIDVFSKFAWGIPLYKKTGNEISKAFRLIFRNSGRHPIKLQTDKGPEFVNKVFQQFLKQNNVIYYHSNNPDTKACVVERLNRTLKARMWKYFTFHSTNRYVEILPKLMHSYNNTVHRSIKMTPSSVNRSNVLTVWNNLYVQSRFL